MPNTVLLSRVYTGERAFHLVQGDLLQEPVEAILNPANDNLAHGGGVAGLISRAGGRIIQVESDDWVRRHGPVSHAEPAYTGAGTLPFRYVIHAVGPIWHSGDEPAKLAAAVRGSLWRAEALGVESVSMPAISTGVFGYPKDLAAPVILAAVDGYLKESQGSLREVRLCLYDALTVAAFESAWASLPPVS
ncbi:MAG: macro domain-containing protein [Anaerolineae bacterium]|nr:MAG: macro domain-containing protein [Anaerolineae bacterium]